jgi:hypothetical protein
LHWLWNLSSTTRCLPLASFGPGPSYAMSAGPGESGGWPLDRPVGLVVCEARSERPRNKPIYQVPGLDPDSNPVPRHLHEERNVIIRESGCVALSRLLRVLSGLAS